MKNEHRHSPRSLWFVTASKLPYTGKKCVPKPKSKVLKTEISSVNEHPVLRKMVKFWVVQANLDLHLLSIIGYNFNFRIQ